ncbi:AAA family ATPase [Pseudomonas protegens]|uniref:AAA family ATPase n=1 Tax=Pseudomonas protegens TaxID=380021 RepID=UPI000F49D8D1|nr:AAA family ATPase [Pseudomonas protegens]
MRYIERDPAAIPSIFLDVQLRERVRDLTSSGRRGETIRTEVYAIRDEVSRATREDLTGQFRSKCAYCETNISSESNLDWFRPPFGAQRADGSVDQAHYSWLVAEWENLYPCCNECNAYKKNHFPIAGSADFGASLTRLRKYERALLIDPCFDRPERYFEIGVSGEFIGKSRRADVTIQVLNLNRSTLLESRLEAIEQFRNAWKTNIQNKYSFERTTSENVWQLLDHDAPHVGAIYIYLWQFTSSPQKAIISRIITSGVYRRGIEAIIKNIGHLPTLENFRQTTIDAPTQEVGQGEHFSDYRPVKSLTISGFKGIVGLEINFPLASKTAGNSLAIVGQNASGKSTILQALALVLIGPTEANKVTKDARIFLAEDVLEASIHVRFWGDDRENRLKIRRTSPRFSGAAERPTRVYGYGPYRLLAQRALKPNKRGKNYRLASLFDDGQRLNGYHGWLATLNEPQRRDMAEILQLLLAAPNTKVRVDSKTLEITTNGRSHPLHSLSSGMQSIVSMCTDLTEALYASGESALQGSCVILVDELDAHLHPTWRIGIVKRLNEAFPNAHLIFSTHDPLTLRGLSAEQVRVLFRDANDATVVKRADWYSDALDIDQVLTSDIFGLFNTHAPDWEATFKAYYELLSKEETGLELSRQDQQQLIGLRDKFQALGVLGNTKRERIMYAVIDRLLARKASPPNEWDPATIEQLSATIQDKFDQDTVTRDQGSRSEE